MRRGLLAFTAAIFGTHCAAAAAQDASPPKRAAILVGVKEYRPDGYNWSPGKPVMLRDLVTPCDGVDAVSAKLQLLGWSYDDQDPESEIAQFCDQPPAMVEAAIRQKVAEFDRPDDLLIIYLAAHGAEVGKRNYVFGPSAKIDVQHEADRLHNHQDNLLFVGSAFDLESAIFRPAGAMYRGNVLVILDTCRDDPVSFSELSRVLGRPVGGPQIDERSPGIVIYYATAPGKRVSDGQGLSHMARRFSEALQAGTRVDKITSAVTRKILEDTVALDNRETPIPSGQFNNTDLCIAGCRQAQVEVPRPVRLAQNRAIASLFRSDAAAVNPAAQSKLPVRRFEYVRGFTLPKNTTIDVEIFWCNVPGAGNEDKAKSLANVLLTQRAMATKTRSIAPGAVRHRELTEEENAQSTLQLSDDIIRVDFDSADEAAFAERVKTNSPFPLRFEKSRLRSVDSVAVYLCSGAAKQVAHSKLSVQAARDDQRGVASALSEVVGQSLPAMSIADVDARPETQKNSPDGSQVRYFYENDEAKAVETATLIAKLTGQEVSAKYLPNYSETSAPGDMELWIGRQLDPDAAAVALAGYYATKE